MSGKKWCVLFISALAAVFIVWGALNFIVDPFGTFGSKAMPWDSYSQTLNPRNGKAIYVSRHFDEYDSYIVGSSSAASYLPESLNAYLGGSFYNMFHYGADTEYDKKVVSYLLENDDVKHIFLVLGINEAVDSDRTDDLTEWPLDLLSGESGVSYRARFLFASPSYAVEKLYSRFKDTDLPQPFDVFVPETGCYDKRVRDAEPIGTLSEYTEKYRDDFYGGDTVIDLDYVDQCVADVEEIAAMCRQAGAELTVVCTPVCRQQLDMYSESSLDYYYSRLAQSVDYWNFAVSPISYDERFFYDITHTRNSTAEMVLGKIFDDDSRYCPPSFGVRCEAGVSVPVSQMKADAVAVTKDSYTQTVPILLYHHLSEGDENDTSISPDTFSRQMALLAENGYNSVTFEDLTAFVQQGRPLPEKPFIITFDDGYLSNYQYAFPVLKQYGYKATVFVIGSSVGHYRYYKDTQYELTPHFGREEIKEMLDSELISIQSHTYDMHQWEAFEDGGQLRKSILPLDNENESEYTDALNYDITKQNELFAEYGMPISNVMAFPGGLHQTVTDVVLMSRGYKATVTTDGSRVNTLVCGLSQSLIDLGRMNISGDTSDEDILAYLASQSGDGSLIEH